MDRRLTCTLPALHQNTTVKFYKMGNTSPIGTVTFYALRRVAVHTITGAEASTRARYWCQYEMKSLHTAQLFTSTQSDTATVDGADQNPVRLVNGSSRCAGRVEIFYQNRWGPVCDDNWNLIGGQVVCRQLNCGVVLSAPGDSVFGYGASYWLDDVTCQGTEAELSECPGRPWGQHYCSSSEAASVVCSGDLPKPGISIFARSSRDRQLTCTLPPLHQNTTVKFYKIGNRSPIGNMPLSAQGIVAVHTITGAEASTWARYWCQYEVRSLYTAQLFMSTQSDTATVDGAGDLPKPGISIFARSSRDRQLTCTLPPLHQNTTVKFYKIGNRSPIGNMPLSAQGIVAVHTITGAEASTRARYWCQYEVRSLYTAQLFTSTQSDTATVDGADQNPVRLVNGSSRCAGRVEIFYQNRWGPVCDDNWNLVGGQVICRQLNCGVVLSAPGDSVFGYGASYWLDDVTCQGTEAELSECPARPWGQHNCAYWKAASAVCSGDLPKPGISISATSSRDRRLTCTLPALHQNTTVKFYKIGNRSPIGTVSLYAQGRVAVHTITGAEVSTRARYWCQYEVKSFHTAQLFTSTQSDTATVDSAGPGFSVTLLAACIVVPLVILAAVITSLIIVCRKRKQRDPVVKKAESAAENNTYDISFIGEDLVKAGECTSNNGKKIQNSSPLTHIYENFNVASVNCGVDIHHIYEKIGNGRTEPRRAHHDQRSNDNHASKPNRSNTETSIHPTQDASGEFGIIIKNNHTSEPSTSKTETTIYQDLCKDTMEKTLYETLKVK